MFDHQLRPPIYRADPVYDAGGRHLGAVRELLAPREEIPPSGNPAAFHASLLLVVDPEPPDATWFIPAHLIDRVTPSGIYLQTTAADLEADGADREPEFLRDGQAIHIYIFNQRLPEPEAA